MQWSDLLTGEHDGTWPSALGQAERDEIGARSLASVLSLPPATLKVLNGKRLKTLECVLSASERVLSRMRGISGDELVANVKEACLSLSSRALLVRTAHEWFDEARAADKKKALAAAKIKQSELNWEELRDEDDDDTEQRAWRLCQAIVKRTGPGTRKRGRTQPTQEPKKKKNKEKVQEEQPKEPPKKRTKRAAASKKAKKTTTKKKPSPTPAPTQQPATEFVPIPRHASSHPPVPSSAYLTPIPTLPPLSPPCWVKLCEKTETSTKATTLCKQLQCDPDVVRTSVVSEEDSLCEHLMEVRMDMVADVAQIIASMATEPSNAKVHLTVYINISAIEHQVHVNRAYQGTQEELEVQHTRCCAEQRKYFKKMDVRLRDAQNRVCEAAWQLEHHGAELETRCRWGSYLAHHSMSESYRQSALRQQRGEQTSYHSWARFQSGSALWRSPPVLIEPIEELPMPSDATWSSVGRFRVGHDEHRYRPYPMAYSPWRSSPAGLCADLHGKVMDMSVSDFIQTLSGGFYFPAGQLLFDLDAEWKGSFPSDLSKDDEVCTPCLPPSALLPWGSMARQCATTPTPLGASLMRQVSSLAMLDSTGESMALETTLDTPEGELDETTTAKSDIKELLQRAGLSTSLFEYQLNTLVWARAVEEGVVQQTHVEIPAWFTSWSKPLERVYTDKSGNIQEYDEDEDEDEDEEEEVTFTPRVQFDYFRQQLILPDDTGAQPLQQFRCDGGILSDEVGLGKTLSTLALIMSSRLDLRCLLTTDGGVDAAVVARHYPKAAECRLLLRRGEDGDADADQDMDSADRNATVADSQPSLVLVERLEEEFDRSMRRCPDPPQVKEEEEKEEAEEEKEEEAEEGLCEPVYLSRATVVVAPSHLVQQWHNEILKHFEGAGVRVCVITTLPHHRAVRGWDLVSCDVVLVSSSYFKGSYAKAIKSKSNWKRFHSGYKGEKEVNALNQTCPPFHLFKFHRVVFDEAHELCSLLMSKDKPAVEIFSMRSRTRWLLTATPFPDNNNTPTLYFNLLNFRLNNQLVVPDAEELEWTTQSTAANTKYAVRRFLRRIRSLLSSPVGGLLYQCLKQTAFRRNTKQSIGAENTIPGAKEHAVVLQMTPLERAIYNMQEEVTDQLRVCANPFTRLPGVYTRFGIMNKPQEEIRQSLLKAYADQRKRHSDTLAELKNTLAKLQRASEAETNAKARAKELGVTADLVFMRQELGQELYELMSRTISTLTHRIKMARSSIKSTATNLRRATKCLGLTKTVPPMVCHSLHDPCDACDSPIFVPLPKQEEDDEMEAEEEEEEEPAEWQTEEGRQAQSLVALECGHHVHRKCIELDATIVTCPVEACKRSLQISSEVRLISTPEDAVKLKESLRCWKEVVELGTKLAHLVAFVSKTLAEDVTARIIVFSAHRTFLNTISNALDDVGVASVSVQGNVMRRAKALRAFQTESEQTSAARVIMLSLDKSASGADLTLATHLLMTDPLPGSAQEARTAEQQAIGRGRRQGMTRHLTIVRLVMAGTVEQTHFANIRRSHSMK